MCHASMGLNSSRPHLRICLLGPPSVTCGNAPLNIPRRIVRAILYRLAGELQPIRRGDLILLFWPDETELVARRNLSHHLTHLRQILPSAQILQTCGDLVWLDANRVWCDAARLKNLLLEPVDLQDFDEPIALYQGTFLEGFDLPGCPEFEQWCLTEGSLLERIFLEALEGQVDRCIQRGEISRALRYAQRYLNIDELSEAMHRRLIRIYASMGDRTKAMRQYEVCASILEQELGVGPLPETQAIYRAVIQGLPRFPERPPQVLIPKLPGIDLPIFGRDEELRQLDATLEDLEEGRSRILLVSGEAGVGKSRLIMEFAQRHSGDIRVHFGRGRAGEQVIPYQTILEPLGSMLGIDRESRRHDISSAKTGLSPVDYCDPFWLAEISRLIPELRIRYPDLPEVLPLDPESAQRRLFEALCRFFLTYSSVHGTTVLCLDDLQWLDATTKAWFVHIGRELISGENRILILGTYRSEEAEAIEEMRRCLAEIGVLDELELKGMSEATIQQLLHHLIGRQAGIEPLVKNLFWATGGNPFFLIEVLREIIEADRLKEILCQTGQIPLPGTVREAILTRLRKLSPIARQVLESGAILGLSFDLDLIRLTAGRGHAEIIDALDELVAKVLLVEEGANYHFIHELTCRAVQKDLSQVRWQLLHRRASRAYQHIRPDAIAALEYHFEQGAVWEKALHYHGLSVRDAKSLFDWQDAVVHQMRMLEAISKIDPQCVHSEYIHQRGEILADRAHLHYLQGRLAERNSDLAALHDLGESTGDDEIRLRAILHHVRYFNLDGEYNRAIVAAQKGLELLSSSRRLIRNTELHRAARSRLLGQIGFAHNFLGQPVEALGVLEDALTIHAENVDYRSSGSILNILGYVYFHLGDYPRSLECQEQAFLYHQEGGDYSRMAWDLIDIGALNKNMGDLFQARRFLEEGLNLARRVGSLPAEAYGLTHLGSFNLCLGDYAAALDQYRQVIRMQQVLRSEHITATAEAGVGLALYHLGDYAESRAWLGKAESRAQACGNCRRWGETLIELGMVELAEKDMGTARQHIEKGLEIARDSQAGECLVAGLALQARLERLTGRADLALKVANEATNAAQQIGLSCCEMWGEIEAGLANLKLGALSAALDHTRQATRLAEHASQDWIGSEQAHLAYACVLRTLGCVEVAEQQLAIARSIIHDKAIRITEPDQRARYLAGCQSFLIDN